MYIIMHGDKSGRLHSTQQSIGIKPINLLKQLHKKFPSEKEFYICCCYSNYCFPNGVVEYNGVTLTPMIWSNYPVSHYMIWEDRITKCIMQQWLLPFPEEVKEEETKIILIKEWCQKHHFDFNNLVTIDENYEGETWNSLLKGNEAEICKKLNIDFDNLLEKYCCWDANDFVRAIFDFMFPNYELYFYKRGNMFIPHYLSEK